VHAAEVAGPAVVSITTVQRVKKRSVTLPFRDEWFERFLRDRYPAQSFDLPGMGSGFVVRGDGYILTNEHVVRGADAIKVTLADGRVFEGEAVGSDSTYDIAIIRVDGDELPTCAFGDSDQLMVGEWSIAIGNPFAFLLNDARPSVTVGVISATRRDVRAATGNGVYKNMIQTDAAVNPGNSGGPLVDSNGAVIGVNTFIFSKSGGSLGMGFAIPINTARRVAEEIIRFGHVREIWIGISVEELSPYLAELLEVEYRPGLVITTIDRGSPADRAGLLVGDLIVALNGEAVTRTYDAQRQIFGAADGDRLRIEFERQGERQRVEVRVELAPDERNTG